MTARLIIALGMFCKTNLNPATCEPPTPAGGSRHRSREVALLRGASGRAGGGSTIKQIIMP